MPPRHSRGGGNPADKVARNALPRSGTTRHSGVGRNDVIGNAIAHYFSKPNVILDAVLYLALHGGGLGFLFFLEVGNHVLAEETDRVHHFFVGGGSDGT